MYEDITPMMMSYASKYASLVRSSRHCAAILDGKKILTLGVNRYKTHPIMLKYGRNEDSIYLHAEMDAIVKYSRMWADTSELSDCSIYVIRINKRGELMPSCPCEGCMKAIKAFEFKEVHWS
jgi:deoxycytidylate deaminase